MATPTYSDDAGDPVEAEPEPRRKVRVPIEPPDVFGGYRRTIEVDAEAAGQWDARQWHDRPPL